MLAFGSGYDQCNQLFIVPDSKAHDNHQIVTNPQNIDIDLTNIASISLGVQQSAYITTDGRVFGIGDDRKFSLGTNFATNLKVPHEIVFSETPGCKFVTLQCGKDYSIYLTDRGTIIICSDLFQKKRKPQIINFIKSPKKFARCWDLPIVINAEGEATVFETKNKAIKPFKLPFAGIKDICYIQPKPCHGFTNHTFLILFKDGTIFANGFLNGNNPNFIKLKFLEENDKIVQICSGYFHFVALSENGIVYTCGINEQGELGTGNYIGSYTFVPLLSLRNHFIVQIDAGYFHSTFLSSEGRVFSCGFNFYRQLVQCSALSSIPIPTEICISGPFTFVTCGANSTMIFKNWIPSTGNDMNTTQLMEKINKCKNRKKQLQQKIGEVEQKIKDVNDQLQESQVQLNNLIKSSQPAVANSLENTIQSLEEKEFFLIKENEALKSINFQLKEQVKSKTALSSYLEDQTQIIGPSQLSDFETISEISNNSVYVISKVIHIPTRNLYTRKTLNLYDISVDVFQQFLKECDFLRNIKHLCVANIYGFSFLNDDNCKPTIIFEYLPQLLSSVIENGNIGPTRICVIVAEIILGMRYTHSFQVIHRDLRPQNIMLTETYHAKICNFGLAACLDLNKTLSQNVGTFDYMSPEVADGRSYGQPTDVYSFGVLLFYMITKKVPSFQVKENTELIRSLLPPNIPQFVLSIIENCWRRDPESRPTFDQIYQIFKHNSFKIFEGVDEHFIFERIEEIELFEQMCPNEEEDM
ncbi:hypothetical protein TRFO_20922 [Tritrichomonas foetus]|uniref:non-specific serine/threonine protein kinase n=1 Tax=Tritrichomonas foetus TaxID=1144522 RepID=A0A1J4KEX7_9EUKA|nr:hypothetical protein TRFO_20922 [Tritrichomonas foetus]|eukprot:OHT10009.1 hypothetical protein TRFO_20922 [Tritrichomonas foetus]